MTRTKLLGRAAMGALVMTAAACATTPDVATSSGSMEPAKGECHGINACKGQGDCGGKGTSCAGTNACKGHGWKSMDQESCEAKGGEFRAGAM